MSETVISVENVSKIYRLGEVGTGSLAHDINRWWHRIRDKEDPYLQIGQINDRTQTTKDLSKSKENLGDWVYALKDINFEVKQGEVLGIIGRNGAGKSTLLKILSRVTAQTTGRIKVKGRIASLLEVGTGFHPELTGRENIFLNGAILGMRRAEIASKFDEIVEFSGCARYIDTPVKRYSSGMYVRLAFAVAAHLEPEILIIDEVLAVGDAEFQRKCLGKMSAVANQGRTVLFVSHNMSAVATLCTKCILMQNGSCSSSEATASTIAKYAATNQNKYTNHKFQGRHGDETLELVELKITGLGSKNQLETSNPIEVLIAVEAHKLISDCVISFFIESATGKTLAISAQYDNPNKPLPTELPRGRHVFKAKIPPNTLAKGAYRIIPNIGIHNQKRIVNETAAVSFTLENTEGLGLKFITGEGQENMFRPQWEWVKET